MGFVGIIFPYSLLTLVSRVAVGFGFDVQGLEIQGFRALILGSKDSDVGTRG